jgi:hypothetical protein
MSDVHPAATEQPTLGSRAKYRLRLAAGLLRAQGHRFDIPREQFYEHIAIVLERLPAAEREWLKALVDWVEAFDPKDELGADAARRAAPRRGGSQR